nr:hypothetical protein [bacterium]
ADYNALAQCVETNCASDQTIECYLEKCESESNSCGIKKATAYGTASFNVNMNEIGHQADAQDDTRGIMQSAFATGTYGSSNLSFEPAGVAAMQSSVTYIATPQQGDPYLDVTQVPVFDQGGQAAGGNPVVIVSFDPTLLAVGTIEMGPYQGMGAFGAVVDVNWSTQQVTCYHGFFEGNVNVTQVGDITAHGAFAFTGNVDLIYTGDYNFSGTPPTACTKN